MTDEEREIALCKLRDNLELFACQCLKIKDKSGDLKPLVLNRAQRHIHEKLEEQLKNTGKVRAIILKGRKQGASTYIAARFYHKAVFKGRSAFIVAHEDLATTGLFEIVQRYQINNPVAPSTKASNAKELIFKQMDCGYKLATAGTDDVGRGNTAQLIHGSEYAYWRNPQKHMAGLGNVVGNVDGTEFVLESTANGIGNGFHNLWQEAEAGNGEFIAIFTPWFWDDSYRSTVAADFIKTAEEILLAETYGLDNEQLQFRRNKISSYGDGFAWLFQQEFPNCAAEAFVIAVGNPLINPSNVMAAVNSTSAEMNAPLIIGCDPAGDGIEDADRTAICFRRGRTVFRMEYHQGLDTMQIAGLLSQYNTEHKPDGLIIDKGGLGAGVYDRLNELNVPVIGINSAQRATDSERYENIRAEMWWLMSEWFADKPCRIPNNAALISDLTAPQPKVSSNGRKLLEKKEHMKARQVRSPDGADAMALTFAIPVSYRDSSRGARPTRVRPAATSAGY